MRGLLLDVMENKVEVVEVNGLDDYYRLIGCSLVDITQREIAGKYYEIICDDEGLLREILKFLLLMIWDRQCLWEILSLQERLTKMEI